MYRIHEAVMHYAEAIKAIMSEELGVFRCPCCMLSQGLPRGLRNPTADRHCRVCLHNVRSSPGARHITAVTVAPARLHPICYS